MGKFSKKIWTKRLLLLGALLTMASSEAWASNASCAALAGTNMGSYGAAGTGNGCWLADQSFSNFSASGLSTPATTDIYGSTTFSSVTTPWTDTATFAKDASNWSATGNSGSTTTSTFAYLTNTQQTYINEGVNYHNPGSGQAVFITSASLAAAGSTGNGATSHDDAMSVTMTFCIGQTVCTSTNEVTLTATWGDNDSTPAYGCTVGSGVTSRFTCGSSTSASPITVTFSSSLHIPTLTVNELISMTTDRNSVFGNTTDTLTSITNTFGNAEFTPEPSTFVMLSSALLGLGGLHLRRRTVRGKRSAKSNGSPIV